MISKRNREKGMFKMKTNEQKQLILNIHKQFLKEKKQDGFFKFFDLDYYFGDYDANTIYAVFLEDGTFILANENVIYGKIWKEVDQGKKYTWYEQSLERKYQLYEDASDEILIENMGNAPWHDEKLFDMNGKKAFAISLSDLLPVNQIVGDYDIALLNIVIKRIIQTKPFISQCFRKLNEELFFEKLLEETTILENTKEMGPQLFSVSPEVDMVLSLPTFSKKEIELKESIKQKKIIQKK